MILQFYVTKADGSRQLFDREKVAKTCLRMGVNRRIAYEVADEVEARLYDGMPTSKVLKLIFPVIAKTYAYYSTFFGSEKRFKPNGFKTRIRKVCSNSISTSGVSG
jgi:hypothetical protein